ncbi:MAG: biotin/lipoyl-containing protein [Candidatus Binatia bacterium]
MHITFTLGARHLSVTQQRGADGRLEVSVDGTPHAVEATLLDATTLRLVVDGATHTLPVARVGDAVHVAIDGEVYVLAPQAPDTADTGAILAAPQIVAPMPGKVLQVLVQAGQAVASGDGLLILEAMKMEHRIVAEAAATVQAVHVVDGQMVDAGVVLVELEYPAAP